MKIKNSLLLVGLLGVLASCGGTPTTATPTNTPTTVAPTTTVVPTTTATPTTTVAPTQKPTTAPAADATVTGLKVENLKIASGEAFASHSLKVIGVYSDGAEQELDASKYEVTLPSESVAKLGIKSEVTVKLKENASISNTVSYDVYARLEGELGKQVNSKVKTEPEYVIQGEEFVLGEDVSFAGGFAAAIKAGNEGSVTLTFVSATNASGEFTVRMSNSNLQKTDDGYYYMEALRMNTILDLTINGKAIAISDDVIIPGTPVYTIEKSYAPCYGVYHNITFKNVEFEAGLNNIKFSFKPSTIGGTSCWDESPSEGNIDYVDVITKGSVVTGDIASIRVDEKFVPNYADKLEDTVVIATTTTNQELTLEKSQVTIVDADDATNAYYLEKTNNLKVTLVNDSSITCTYSYEIAKEYLSKVKWEDIEIDEANSKVYWTFEFNNRGYTADQYRLFDGSTTFAPAEVETTLFTIKFKIDVTNFSAATYYPHAQYTVDGVTTMYPEHKNGDLLVGASQYNAAAGGTFNGKTYSLVVNWGMATLVVA